MRQRLNNNAGSLALLALIVSLLGTGAVGANAVGVLVGSKQIRNGSILTQDIHKSAVKSSDIGPAAVQSTDVEDGAIDSTDIGNGEVEPQDVTMPDPAQLKESDVATFVPTVDFALLDIVGSYSKDDPTSVLEVDWTGSVEGHNGGEASGCVFQLRVDGQPPAGGGGEIFGKGLTSASASALFPGLAAGPHQVEIWARKVLPNTGMGDSCTVGPAEAGIKQTVVVSELVV
jgi:hypothetical protein